VNARINMDINFQRQILVTLTQGESQRRPLRPLTQSVGDQLLTWVKTQSNRHSVVYQQNCENCDVPNPSHRHDGRPVA
jgi:hypothetical protein